MKSYFHNGTAHGDALEAPYGAELFASLLSATYAPQHNCVVWNTGQNALSVAAGAGRSVDVNTGTAFISGIFYINSAVVNLTLDQNNSTYPRVDSIIIRFVQQDNQARLAVKSGIPSAYPAPPPIKSNELLLANIYLSSGFAATADATIYDKREFVYNSDHAKYFYLDNCMVNSEFISFAGAADGSNASPPDYWSIVGAPTFYHADKFDQQARGRSIHIVASATNQGMSTTFLYPGTARMFTMAMLLKVVSGTVQVSWAGTSKTYYPTQDVEAIYIRVSTTGAQTLSVQSTGGAAEFYVGQITVTQGYITYPFEETSEVLFNTNYGTPATTLTNRSTGAVERSYTTFGSNVLLPQYIKSVILQIRARDSGSAGSSTARIAVGENLINAQIWVGGLTNDTYREGFCIARFEGTDNENIVLNITASGAGTFDAIVYVTGIIV